MVAVMMVLLMTEVGVGSRLTLEPMCVGLDTRTLQLQA